MINNINLIKNFLSILKLIYLKLICNLINKNLLYALQKVLLLIFVPIFESIKEKFVFLLYSKIKIFFFAQILFNSSGQTVTVTSPI